jgi:calcium-dependent protein kinase
MTTKVGTAYYVAPEILDYRVNFDGYDRTVDIWALGLVFDELLHGSPFYNGTSEEEVFSKIKNDHYFIRDSTYRESTIFDLRKYTIK